MNQAKTSHFDQAAATWDDNPSRIALMKAVGEGILREVQPTKSMDVLDYGCGTGLVGVERDFPVFLITAWKDNS
jgi:predicted TPR repeat methyltransferase